MMKGKSFVVLLTITAACTSALAAQLDVGLSADIFDKYIWRGQNLGNKAVIQPSATIGKGGYSLNVWGNMPYLDKDVAGKPWSFNELDYTFDYSATCPLTGADLSAGFIVYTYPRPVNQQPQPKSTQELYLSAGYSNILLQPTLTVYKDIKENTGWYMNASVQHSVALPDELSVDLGASLGWGDNNWNKTFWNGAPAGLNDLVLSAAVPFELAGIELVPSLSYVTLVDNKIRSGRAGTTQFGTGSSYWILGIGAAVDF